MTADSSTSDSFKVSSPKEAATHVDACFVSGSSSNPEQPSSCWFLSVSCIDDIAQSPTTTPDRSAFDPYQRPLQVLSLFDASLEEEEDVDEVTEKENENTVEVNGDERDDVGSFTPAYWPSIEQTFSFDDWNMDDETPVVLSQPVSPVFFRFDQKECSKRAFRIIPGDMVKTSIVDDPNVLPTVSFDSILSGRSNNRFIEQSSSMVPLPPSSDSYFFQPIREGRQGSLGSEDTSAAPTMSMISVDPLSLTLERDDLTFDHMTPVCRAIPRLASFEEHIEYPQAILRIDIELPTNHSLITTSFSSITYHYAPPIPEFVFVPTKSPKGARQNLLRSWKMVFRIGRKKNLEPPKKQVSKSSRNRKTKGGLGKF